MAAIERFLLPQLNELKGMITALQGTLEGKIKAVQGTLSGEIAPLRSEIKRLDEKTNERIAALRIHDRLARLEAKVGLLE